MVTNIKDETKYINNEERWRMMLGWQQNSEECEPISPQLIKLSNKTYIHQRAPIPVWKVSKAIKRKMLWCSCEAQKASNGPDVNKGNRSWANRNEGHPSYYHGLKHRALKPLNDRY